jgi:hypothetical protein
LYANGKLYFSSKQGHVTVLEASRSEPEILARNRMNARFIASPAVGGSSLILRSTTHLYCLAKGYQRSAAEVARDMPRERGGTSADKPKSTRDKLTALKRQIDALQKSGKLTRQEAEALFQSATGKN